LSIRKGVLGNGLSLLVSSEGLGRAAVHGARELVEEQAGGEAAVAVVYPRIVLTLAIVVVVLLELILDLLIPGSSLLGSAAEAEPALQVGPGSALTIEAGVEPVIDDGVDPNLLDDSDLFWRTTETTYHN